MRRLAAAHPYGAGSIALHALLATLLLQLPGLGEAERQRADTSDRARAELQVVLTQSRETRRQLDRMAAIRHPTRTDAGALPAQARAERPAAQASAAILRRGARVTLPTRAQISAANEAAAHAPASPASGSTAQRSVAAGYLRSPMEQLAAMTRVGSPQGRVGVVGSAGGLSVNREGVQGVAGGQDGRAADTGPDELGPPTKGSHDLVSNVDAVEIDPTAVQRAAGRTFGAGGVYATRAYINGWYVIGPFAGRAERSMEASYPPEQDIDLDGAWRGLAGRILTWKYANRGFYPFVPPDQADNAVYYAYTELRMDEDRDVWLAMAGDDDTMLWLDRRLIWVSPPGDKPWYHPPFYLQDERAASLALVEGRRRVHLVRGMHRLLVKLYNKEDRSFFSVVIAP